MKVTEQQIVDALASCGGFQSEASRKLGITRSALSQRISKNKRLKERVDDLRECQLDLAESKLMEKIKCGNVQCILFYLKTKGKERGYSEKFEPVQDNWGDIEIKFVD